MKLGHVGAEYFLANRPTDGNDEANSRRAGLRKCLITKDIYLYNELFATVADIYCAMLLAKIQQLYHPSLVTIKILQRIFRNRG